MAALRELENEQEYEAELSQCVGATGFHHWFFLTAMADAFNLTLHAYAVESAGVPLGVVPLLFRRRGPVSSVNSLSFRSVGPLPRGEALRAGRLPELTGAVEPVLRKQRALVTVWEFPPGLHVTPEEVALPGFDVFESQTYVVPGTRSVDDCWKAMSQLRRRSVRRCESLGFTVTDGSREEITQWLPGQVSGVYAHQGALASYTLAEARVFTERLAAHPRVRWRTVRSAEGEVLAMTGSVIGAERVEAWLMGGPHLPKVSAHSLAYWDLVNWALPQGLTLDFGGAPSDGVRTFKVSAGCEPEAGVSARRVRFRSAYERGLRLHHWGVTRLAALRPGS